jgi:recombination protein RecA
LADLPTEAPTTFKEKLKALEAVQKIVDKEYGEGSLRRMGSKDIIPIAVIPTGIADLDHRVIGAGGIPRGRITEIFGPESCGKTTAALTVIAQAQRLGGTAGYIDAEHALDPVYARQLGVDMDNVYLSQPDYGEQGLSIAEAIIATNACDVLVIDSVAALVPKVELDGDMEDQNIGLHARLMSKAMRKLAGVTRKSGTALIFINQTREKVGVMYGNPETTTGGKALRFYASLRLRMSIVGEQIKEAGIPVASTTKFKAVKNKLASPFRETQVAIHYGKGYDTLGSLVELVNNRDDIVEKKGSWIWMNGTKLANGTAAFADLLRADDKLRNVVESRVKEVLTKG